MNENEAASEMINQIRDQELARRRDLLEYAATEQRWKDPAIASRVVPTENIQTTGDAAAAVRAYTQAHPEHASPAPISEEEQTQRWGKEMLDGLMGGGRQ